MTSHTDYAPRRPNPAAEIVDLKPPAFLLKQDRPRHVVIGKGVPLPTVEVEPAVWPQQDDPRLAEYIDEGAQRFAEAATQPPRPEPKPPADPTDKQYVALNIDRLRHLDLKAVVAEMFGETLPTSAAEIADKMATWAAANNPRAAA